MTARPLSPYGLQKYVGELYCALFPQLYTLETVSLRYFNVYGPLQRADSPYAPVIPAFIAKLENREQPTIYGNGDQTRDFVFIDDVVALNILAIKAPQEAIGEAFNIGGGSGPCSINRLYRTVASTLSVTIQPRYEASRPGDISTSFANTAKARKLLRYSPSTTIEKGVKKCIAL
jgi:nucleoside-diphosphate-sugar epimerase